MKNKKSHSPTGKFVGYIYCVKCGLVYLKNQATKTAIKLPCSGEEYHSPE